MQASESPGAAEPPAVHRSVDLATCPVFILGIQQRSGTNFLADLLRLDSTFQLPKHIWETGLIKRAARLREYVDVSIRSWHWIGEGDESPRTVRRALLEQLGGGLLAFLTDRITPGKRLLCKTPSPKNIGDFFLLFPNTLLIILIRDGRDAVESAKRSWPEKNYRQLTEQWARGAREIIEFMQSTGEEYSDRWLLTKYEELVSGCEEVRKVVRFVGTDERNFPFDRISHLPLRGSSTERGGQAQVHWAPVPKPSSFRPMGKWREWSFWQKRQFKRLAGRELIQLGYADDLRW